MKTIIIPKVIKRKMNIVDALCKMREIKRLRIVRDTSKDLIIDLYHHSEGTESYFHDVEKRYYTLEQIKKNADRTLQKDQWLMTVVLPYAKNVVFTSGVDRLAKLN